MVEPQPVVNGSVAELFGSVMMFWTGHQRPAASVLAEQKVSTARNLDMLREMRNAAYELRALFAGPYIDIQKLGAALDRGWQLKRCLVPLWRTVCYCRPRRVAPPRR